MFRSKSSQALWLSYPSRGSVRAHTSTCVSATSSTYSVILESCFMSPVCAPGLDRSNTSISRSSCGKLLVCLGKHPPGDKAASTFHLQMYHTCTQCWSPFDRAQIAYIRVLQPAKHVSVPGHALEPHCSTTAGAALRTAAHRSRAVKFNAFAALYACGASLASPRAAQASACGPRSRSGRNSSSSRPSQPQICSSAGGVARLSVFCREKQRQLRTRCEKRQR